MHPSMTRGAKDHDIPGCQAFGGRLLGEVEQVVDLTILPAVALAKSGISAKLAAVTAVLLDGIRHRRGSLILLDPSLDLPEFRGAWATRLGRRQLAL